MIYYIQGDITDVTHGYIMHGVNCKGVMGSGVAKAIRNKWPKVFTVYKRRVMNKRERYAELLGTVQIVRVTESPTINIINAFTQITYGRKGKHADVNAIRSCLEKVCSGLCKNGELCIPKIGCGLGGLSWEREVLPIIEDMANQYNTTFLVYQL